MALKKRKFLVSKEIMAEAKFRVADIGSKCTFEKTINLGGFDVTFAFMMRTPTRQKDIEQIPSEKMVVDGFPTPFRGGP